MKTKPDKPFAFGCSLAVFPPEEIDALTESGSRLEAIAAGAVRPTTREEKHFLLVHQEKAEPETLLERAWLRLLARREFERGDQPKPPDTATAKDYGMVEFDADRCWW